MINLINKFFNKFIKENDKSFKYSIPSELEIKTVCINLPKMEWFNKLDNPTGTILIIDDQKEMVKLLCTELKRVQYINVMKNFNIVTYTGEYLGFPLIQHIKEKTIPKIDIAILDITLGGIIDGIEYDGIDISIELRKAFPDVIFKYITGHSMNKKISTIFNYITKFKEYFGESIESEYSNGIRKHLINKTDNRIEAIGLLIEKFDKRRKDEISIL